MHICIYICINVCVCVCVYICMYVYAYKWDRASHCCSPVYLLDACRASSLGNTSGGLLLNRDDFIYDF